MHCSCTHSSLAANVAHGMKTPECGALDCFCGFFFYCVDSSVMPSEAVWLRTAEAMTQPAIVGVQD